MTETFTLQFIGHAGIFLKTPSVKLLCDPWLSESGAFLHTWHQYPPNDFIERQSLYDADYLYISHDHDDHFDKDFLRDFPKDKVTVIIADFISDTFAQEIAHLGFPRIKQLQDWEEHKLGDNLNVLIVKDSSLYKIDSALLIKVGNTNILHKNDCHIPDEDIPKYRSHGIDLLFAQFSGAMWYPATYAYGVKKQQQIAAKLKKDMLDNLVNFANGIDAKEIVHSAGPPCFLEDELFHLNFSENGIFHDQWDVYQELATRLNGNLQLLLPGDDVAIASDGKLQVKSLCQSFDFSEKVSLLNEYKRQRTDIIQSYLKSLPQPGLEFMQKFTDHLQQLFSASNYLTNKVNALVKFILTGDIGGCVYVDTRNQHFAVMQSSIETPNYQFTIDSAIANLLVEGKEEWEDLFLSMRFAAKRRPDVYNWPLFAVLRYGKEPQLIAQVENVMREAENETILVRDEFEEYQVQRYCPHAGADLSHAKIQDGKLICPRHQWVFDLHSGECIVGGNMPLKVCESSHEKPRVLK
ncbi:MAG: Rieske 2Fe-2S domain-containing protein [Nostoc sp. DedVER02]|uniref:Rieske 2Fe-2S domain-containing protein n=1 Tax=unclassified Nostoc TaxID=2593658 RepID=UPI002AD55B2D|nr:MULTISPECIES: MBL fold metallo-hydrolase [unclassified Nostoc]MDZ7988026.1 MBL fold metallo-hydrolase [Nostoc sp. DedVER02]MDZ8114950.1 MBL fold metallo-hydrolase [Nostoc sp. DedVER01b]